MVFRNWTVMMLATSLVASASADVIVTTPLQVGGFFDGGGADNHIEHQNYFVGYGTVGGVRTTERRSFYWYHIPSFSGAVMDVSIKLKMAATTSIIFGLSPEDPLVHDTIETFQLGATPISPLVLVDPDITPTAGQFVFDALDDHPVAAPHDFVMGSIPEIPFALELHLNSVGIGLVDTHRGADIVLTGWMPSWTEDLRVDAGGHFLEADELLWGLSDIPGIVPAPELTITYAPVPEPAALAVLGGAVLGLIRGRRSGGRPVA
jgi:hypothetical protein